MTMTMTMTQALRSPFDLLALTADPRFALNLLMLLFICDRLPSGIHRRDHLIQFSRRSL